MLCLPKLTKHRVVWIMLFSRRHSARLSKKISVNIASRLAESGPYCHSRMFVCLFVCLSDVCLSVIGLQPTTIDQSQPNLVCRYMPVLAPV